MPENTVEIDADLISRLRGLPNATAQEIAANLSKFNQIAALDADMALVRARRVLECVLGGIALAGGIPVGSKRLDQLLGEAKRAGLLPGVIERYCRVLQEFGNLGAHGAEPTETLNAPDLQTEDLLVVAIPLTAIVRWFASDIVPQLPETTRLTVLTGTQISRAHIDSGLKIDPVVYPERYWGSQDICYAWLDRNPDVYTLLLDPQVGEIVGVINAMPVDDRVFQQIKSGQMNDLEIPPTAIKTFDLPDMHKLYFASIALLPAYESTNAFRILYDAFFDKLLQLAHREIFVSEVVADAITAKGVRLCEYAGMTKVCESDHGSTIYGACLLPPELRATTTRGRSLLNFYRTKYDELKELLQNPNG